MYGEELEGQLLSVEVVLVLDFVDSIPEQLLHWPPVLFVPVFQLLPLPA